MPKVIQCEMQTQVGLTSKTMLSGTAPHPYHHPTSWHEEVRAFRAAYLSGTLGRATPPMSWGKKFPLNLNRPQPANPLSSSQSEKQLLPPTPFFCRPMRSRAEVVRSGLGAGVEALSLGWVTEEDMQSMVYPC